MQGPPDSVQKEQSTTSQNTNNLKDEYDAIGKNVAAKLKSLSCEMRTIAQRLIIELLTQAQFGSLSMNAKLVPDINSL